MVLDCVPCTDVGKHMKLHHELHTAPNPAKRLLTPVAICVAGAVCQPYCAPAILEAKAGLLACLPAAYVQLAAAFVNQDLQDLPSPKQLSTGTDPAG